MIRILYILISIVCLSVCNKSNAQYQTQAQDDLYIVPNPQTARWSYLKMDSTGKQKATIYNSVESFEGDGVNGKIKLRVEEVSVDSPNDTTKSFTFYRFRDGEMMVDTNSWFEDEIFDGKLDSLVRSTINEKYPDLPEEKKAEVREKTKSEFCKTSGEPQGIPRNPKVGKLPDYEFHFKVSIMNIKVSSKDRMIVGTERIQTEAGSFDCFVLEERLTTKVMMVKDVEKIKSWYAYGIGLVKEITYDKNGKLISSIILNKINWK